MSDERDEILQMALDWYGTSYEGDPPEPTWLREARALLNETPPRANTMLSEIVSAMSPRTLWMLKVCESDGERSYIAEVVGPDGIPYSAQGTTPASALALAIDARKCAP